MTLGFLIQPEIAVPESLSCDRRLLAAAPQGGLLRIYALRGDVLSLGRYHMAPERRDVALLRRFSGGRVMPCGDGFVGVALTLPHRSALVAVEPLALSPDQVMNRCVRGILEGLELAGAAAFYPGRDLITVNRRAIGFVSFEVDGHGALLFEAILAVGRDFACLPRLLDRADPTGVVKAEMISDDEATSVGRELGRSLSVEALAECIRRGYEARFEVSFEERPAPAVAAFPEDEWLRQRVPRDDLDRHGTSRTMLGSLDVHLALAGDGTIADLMLAGDFIASSPAVEELEQALHGCPPEAGAVDAVVARVFARPEAFILGIGPLATIGATIAGAAR